MVELVILLFVVLAVACFGLLLPTVVIILAASYLLTFALCRAPRAATCLRPVGVRSRPVP